VYVHKAKKTISVPYNTLKNAACATLTNKHTEQ